jgi:epoxyqueuosine reductase
VNALIRQRALELGFDDCRFADAAPPETAPHFQQWLASQQHGEMAYLARNAHKRVDPQQVLPGCQSVMSLATSYASDSSSLSGTAARQGVIARYARFADYH